jgi:hypothetical protein
VSLAVIKNYKCAEYYGEEIVTNSCLCTAMYRNKNICQVNDYIIS